MPIFTITLNPAFDIHARADRFAPFRETTVDCLSRDAGGKGLNISRALAANGIRSTAVAVLGRDNAEAFTALFRASLRDCPVQPDFRPILRDGAIRENLTLHTAGRPETRLSFRGFTADDAVLDEVAACLPDFSGAPAGAVYLTLTGSVPAGISMDKLKARLIACRRAGVRVVVDSNSFSLDDLIEVSPYLIKPNAEELHRYAGRNAGLSAEMADGPDAPAEAADPAEIDRAVRRAIRRDILPFARRLCAEGIGCVMVSLGAAGAVAVTADEACRALPPTVPALSTIGAGDSSIAGFLSAALDQRPLPDCLRTAVAYGTAACLTPGTLPPLPGDIREIREKVRMERENGESE